MSNTEAVILKQRLILCECGCGNTRPERDKWRRKRKFINGHSLKDPLSSRISKSTGYRLVRCPEDHKHLKEPDGFVAEHRLVWEQFHKASLLPWSHVHHINGIKTDNRPENLEGMTNARHCSLHFTKDMSNRICPVCNTRSYKDKQGYEDWRYFEKMLVCHRCYSRLIWRIKNKKNVGLSS